MSGRGKGKEIPQRSPRLLQQDPNAASAAAGTVQRSGTPTANTGRSSGAATKYDGDKTCRTPHLTDEEIQAAFLKAVNKLLETKDEVIANGYAMIPVLFDTAALEAEHDELLQETQVVSDMVQQCIYENAHVALDQAEYQKRYDALTQRLTRPRLALRKLPRRSARKQTQRANYEAFLKAFEKLPDQLPEFTLETWHGLVDYVTVYAEDDIRFTFKNGQEVKA